MSYWQSLSVFIAVAEEGSFTSAAKKLELTQPTVSFHVDSLEKKFGCPLFERTAKGASLTIYGETLYRNTNEINLLLDKTHREINAMVAGVAGKIACGASTIPAEYIMPGFIAAFLRANPGLEFALHTGDSRKILAGLANGDYPVAVVGVHPGEEYVVQPLWEDELVLVGHPSVADRLIDDSPSLGQILDMPFVARSFASGSMSSVLTTLERNGADRSQLKVVLEVGGNEAVKSAVLNEIGLGFISKWAIRDELANGRLRRIKLPGFKITRQFYAAARPPLIPACVQRFWDYLVDCCANRE